MRKKTSAELAAERDQIEAKIRDLRISEAKKARQEEGHRHRLLGIKVEMLMARDPSLRTRMEVEMHGFCTRPYDRQVFGFSTLSEDGKSAIAATSGGETYFDRLGLPDGHPRQLLPARGRKKAATTKEAAPSAPRRADAAEDLAGAVARMPEPRDGGQAPRESVSPRAAVVHGAGRGAERETAVRPPIPRPPAPSKAESESVGQAAMETSG